MLSCAPIANPPNSAQLGGTPYHSPNLHPGPYHSVGMRPRTGTQTHRQTHRRAWPLYISRHLRLTRNVIFKKTATSVHVQYSIPATTSRKYLWAWSSVNGASVGTSRTQLHTTSSPGYQRHVYQVKATFHYAIQVCDLDSVMEFGFNWTNNNEIKTIIISY